jgi:hypothetical protein
LYFLKILLLFSLVMHPMPAALANLV